MAWFGSDDTGMELIALLVIGVFILIIVFYGGIFGGAGSAACPEGTEPCSSSVSECGCCVRDGLGNLVEFCGGSCPTGFILNPSSGMCCEEANPSNCLTLPRACVGPDCPGAPGGEGSPCTSDSDCSNGLACVGGVCSQQPQSPPTCVFDSDCGPGYSCSNGQCVPCSQGAYCDADTPCCGGYECDLTANVCRSCDRPCSSDADCCEGGVCNSATGTCAYPSSCENVPCSNPGQPCSICPSGSGSCAECTDGSVCSWDSAAGVFACKPSGQCGPGQYACDAPGCASGCCDALTGDCAECVSGG